MYVMITLNLSTGAGYSIVYFCNFNWTTASSVIQHTQIYIGCLISVHLVLLTATSIDLFTKSEWQLLECFFLANAASCLWLLIIQSPSRQATFFWRNLSDETKGQLISKCPFVVIRSTKIMSDSKNCDNPQ